MDEEAYTQTLDVDATLKSGSRRFCFTTTTFIEKKKSFQPPRIEHSCWNRGDGIDAKVVSDRNNLLAPLRRP